MDLIQEAKLILGLFYCTEVFEGVKVYKDLFTPRIAKFSNNKLQ